MKTSDKGIVALMIHEGIVPGPYLDSVGVWTYGIGHTAAAGAPDPAKMKRGTPADIDAALTEVFAVFRRDLAKYEAAVAKVLPNVKQHEFDAAVSFHYNTGAIGRASWVKKLAAADAAGAARGIMDWRKPPEIIKRREAERDLLLLGRYPTGAVTVWQVSDAGKVIWKPAMRLPGEYALAMLRGDGATEKPAQEPVKAPSNNLGKPSWLAALIAAVAAMLWSKK
jgi:lysozyme